MPPNLFLHEEILLLALRDDKGTLDAESTYAYAVGAALLAELIVRSRIELVGDEKDRAVGLLDATPVGEPLLDDSLERIATAARHASLTEWVTRLADSPNLKDRLADGLCGRGILNAEERDVFVFFKRRTYPALNPEPEREIKDRLHNAIFTDGAVDSRTVALLSLADNARLLPLVFDESALKDRRDRITTLVADETLGQAVKDAIQTAEIMKVVLIGIVS